MQSPHVFYHSQAPMCLDVTLKWPRGHCKIFCNLLVTSGRLCDDLEIIERWSSSDLAVISRMEGAGEVTETPQISQNGRAVTIRSKQDSLGDHNITVRSPLGRCKIRKSLRSLKNFNYSLKNWWWPRHRPKKRLSSLRLWAVAVWFWVKWICNQVPWHP